MIHRRYWNILKLSSVQQSELVGGLNPSEKYESIGMISNPIYGRIKNGPNHQPVNIWIVGSWGWFPLHSWRFPDVPGHMGQGKFMIGSWPSWPSWGPGGALLQTKARWGWLTIHSHFKATWTVRNNSPFYVYIYVYVCICIYICIYIYICTYLC